MSDLIRREDAIEAVRKELVCDGRHEAHDKTCRFIADVLLSALPSAEAVEVVRCKDCKHRDHCHETVAHTKDHDGFREHWSEPIKWCSRGERKGGDSE